MRVEYKIAGWGEHRTAMLDGVVKVTRQADDFGNLGAEWACERASGRITVIAERRMMAVLPDEKD
jgi:hypothetical protein